MITSGANVFQGYQCYIEQLETNNMARLVFFTALCFGAKI
jgi:hypothetical protein